jgi:tetratricopeptide (TPR) repeat protein
MPHRLLFLAVALSTIGCGQETPSTKGVSFGTGLQKAPPEPGHATPPEPTHLERGNNYAAKKDYDRAIAEYSKAIADVPRPSTRGLLTQNGWTEGGESEYQVRCEKAKLETDKIKGRRADTYRRRGEDNAAKKDYDHAIEDFSAAIADDPKNAEAYRALRWLRATCPKDAFRDGEKAVEYAKKACQLSGWEDPRSLGTLATGWKDAEKLETLAAA